MRLTEIDIRQAVTSSNFISGKEIFENKLVQICTVEYEDEKSLLLNSSVDGIFIDGYLTKHSQSIQIQRKFGKVTIHGRCDCPSSFNCKHTVAVCLYNLYLRKNSDPLQQIKAWITSIKISELTIDENLNQDDEHYFIGYKIFDKEKQKIHGDLQVYKLKNKNGNITKGTMCSLNNFIMGINYEKIMTYDDREIIGLCMGLYDQYNKNLQFHGKLGYQTLLKLIATNRCFYNNSSIPLVYKEEVFTITFDWLYEDDINSQLGTNIKKEHMIVYTDPMLMIDIYENAVYRVSNSINAKSMERLIKQPLIPREHTVTVYEELGSLLQLPVPIGYSVKTIHSPPIPYIKLFIQTGKYAVKKFIELAFKYDEYIVEDQNFQEKKILTYGDHQIVIFRSKEVENTSISLLERYGFSKQNSQGKNCFEITELRTQTELAQWHRFLNIHIPELRALGWIIEFDDTFNLSFEHIGAINANVEDKNDWFSLSFEIEIDGKLIPIIPLVVLVIREYRSYEDLPSYISIDIGNNRYVTFDKMKIESVLKIIFELHDPKEEKNFLDLQKFECHILDTFDEDVIWKNEYDLLKLYDKLKNFSKIDKVFLPPIFSATLREYQQEGVNWLGFLHDFGFAGILADDMGLGKTIQTLAHLSRLKEIGELTKPSLIVLPTSLIANWKNEIKRFTHNLTFLILHGNQRHEVYDEIEKHDLILTTYPLISRDAEILKAKEFGYIVLDEAQKIKNSKTQMAITIKNFSSEHRLALSGTPIENHLGELWAIFSFLMPGFLGNQSHFKKYYQIPVEKEGDQLRKEQLNRRIKPFIIRRTKEVVATELPPKSEIIKYTQFDSAQAALYESIRVMMEDKVRDAIKASGLGKSHITILDALLKLRQVCCDPSLLSLESAKQVNESAKLELLMDLLDELIQENRKILIFSQFTSMLSIIEKKLIAKKISYTVLTGSTTNREEAVNKFTTGDVNVFLISLKAGGVGLNLVEADTVIHYDPWWNPAVENQATDRAYRIGQTKPVFVYKLIVENTIEQKILELQDKKKTLLNTLFDEGSPNGALNGNELLDLLKL